MRGYLCCKNYGRDVLGANVACEQNSHWSWEGIVWIGRTFVLWCSWKGWALLPWAKCVLPAPSCSHSSSPVPTHQFGDFCSFCRQTFWYFLFAVVIFLFSHLFLKLFSLVLFPLIAWHAEFAINSQECPEHLTGESYQTNKYKIKCRNNDL